ncbi:MAG: hypothetical protein PHS38_11695 [Bacteroidales bacterium]|nr:hypothetical protein [Bacteroidales bacterium]
MIPYDLRAGSSYREWNTFLLKEFDSDYPLIKLRETLYIAQNHVPYYKERYSSFGSTGIDLNRIEDFEQLPHISKDIVSENFDKFINPECNHFFYVTTGGSTGKPMKFLQSNNMWPKEQAFVNNIFAKCGYKPSILKASFRGAQFSKLTKNKFWHYNPIQNEIQFSPFHLNLNNISYYIQEFNNKRPRFIHGYPSAIINFIGLCEKSNLKIKVDIKGVFLISENFEKEDVVLIKNFFNCSVISFYGHSERLIIAPTLGEFAQVYEIDPYYGFFELVHKNGENITKENIRGEIIGTSFDNFAMPLIRYKTEDSCSYKLYTYNGKKQINSIEGRWTRDFIWGKNEEKLSLTAINFHSSIFDNINSYQFIQDKKGQCDLCLTSNNKISESQLSVIYKLVYLKIGHAVELTVKQIESPILTKMGKQLKLIKRID